MNPIKKFQNLEKYAKYSVITIILFSIIVLSLTSVYHVSGDGCWYMSISRFMAENKSIPLHEPLGRDEPFWSPPLYQILAAVIYLVFNPVSHSMANFTVKLISPVFGILSLIFSVLLIKKLTNPKIAFYSAIFLAFIPIFIDYSVLSYVESMLVFFVVLSIYFLVNGRIALSGIAAGLSILTKYNGLFIIPVLIYILYRKHGIKKSFYKNSALIILISLLIASPWFIRNWILLGNPIWPFLNFLFNGYELKSYSVFDYGKLASPSLIVSTYFGIFGVPDGNYTLLSLLNIKYLKILLPVWILGTFIFLIPLFVGFFRKKINSKDILWLWLASYFILFLLYVPNVGFGVSRIILPGFPALAMFWAFGIERLSGNASMKKSFKFIILFIILGFVFTSFAKFHYASSSWNFYKADFSWVASNTNPGDVFAANGQCVPYNTERTSLYFNEESLKKADYVWVNQNFWLDRRAILDDDSLKLIESKNYDIAYSSKETGTKIYRIKR